MGDTVESVLNVLDPLLPLALAATTLAYFLDFRDAPGRPAWLSPAALLVSSTLLVLRFIVFVWLEQRPPLATPAEAFSAIALAITVVYVLLEKLHRDRSLGFPLLAAATLAQSAALFSHTETTQVSALLGETWFGFHAIAAILGYTSFAISAVYGILFLVLYQNLKHHRFGAAFLRMPSLDELATSSMRTAVLGFLFLTAAIIAGTFGWGRLIEGPVWLDPKVLTTMLAWAVYGVGVALWHFAGWRGIRAIGLTLIAFLIMVMSSWVVPWILGSAHGAKGLA